MRKKLFVLLGDVVSSRKIKDRELFQENLLNVCEELNQEYTEDLYSDFKILKGLDEIGAVLKEISNIYLMINEIMDQIYPQKARFVVALDYVDTALNSKDVTKMDGPAFHKASKMMMSLKKSNLLFDISTNDESWDDSMVTMINPMLLYKERWTKNQRQIIKDYEKTLNQGKVAKKHSITQQAVSKVINSTRWKYIRDLEYNINKILSRKAINFEEHLFNYHAFGLNISSQIELPGMMEAIDNGEDIRISRGKVEVPYLSEGPNYLVDHEDVYLWWEDVGQVGVHGGREITVDAEDEDQMIPFLLGPVMSFLLHQIGFLVLHGSAVKMDDDATAFLGYRGYGKSTTAINLYKYGYPLVADDILAIKFDEKEIPYVYPGYLHVRLSDDSYNNVKDKTDVLTPIRTLAGKLFCDASYGFSPEPLRLKRIYILDKGGGMGIFSLGSQENLMDLIRHSVAYRVFSGTDQEENLVRCAKLINNVSIKGLKVNRSFEKLPELVKVIEEDL